jgi:mannose-6-phosphate isomerase-like protein (cupin superfamily)
VYVILQGEGTMRIDDETAPVKKGAVVYIPPQALQSIENTGKDSLDFLCVVDPAWRPEDEEVV